MGSAAVPEFDNGVPAKNEPKDDSPEGGEPRHEADAGPADLPTEAPPRQRRKSNAQREVFAGDLAAVELRSRLALMRDGIPQPEEPVSSIPRFAVFMKVTGGVLMAAAAAGAVGYVLGFNLSSKSTRIPPAARQFSGAPVAAGATPMTPDRGNERPVVQTATAPEPPADSRRADQDPDSVRALPSPEPPVPRTVRPSPVVSPGIVDASEIAARMKIGAELVASGDIAAARKMFERVAEAGEAAGAFALAETYDPMVLETLRLRGAIMPDLALARSWYEKARDLGASAAPERIARLVRNSQ